MKKYLLFPLLAILLLKNVVAQQMTAQAKTLADLKVWSKAVVNIETEGYVYPGYIIDSLYNRGIQLGFDKAELDHLRSVISATRVFTGTAIYATYEGRKYLITAKHVLSDSNIIYHKIHQMKTKERTWQSPIDGIFPIVSLRTPFEYFVSTKKFNNWPTYNNNFAPGPRPFFFITDSTGDGIAIISLQASSYKVFLTLLGLNGYIPIDLKKVISSEKIQLLDQIFTIGFPEGVSVVATGNPDVHEEVRQSTELVTPFIVKGNIAMHDSLIQHFYVDLTVAGGNSGGPVILNGKLIGIISGINKYSIVDENPRPTVRNLYGIGHLVNVINVSTLLKKLSDYKSEEDQLILLEQHDSLNRPFSGGRSQ